MDVVVKELAKKAHSGAGFRDPTFGPLEWGPPGSGEKVDVVVKSLVKKRSFRSWVQRPHSGAGCRVCIGEGNRAAASRKNAADWSACEGSDVSALCSAQPQPTNPKF